MATTATPVLDDTLGALEIGTFISLVLYGVTSVQVYMYYSHNMINDPLRIRILVPFLWVIETFQTISTVYYIYNLTVTNFGNVARIRNEHWSLGISSLFDGLVGALVQAYFAHRIHVLSTTWTVTVVSWIGSVLALIGSTSVMVLGLTIDIPEFEARYVWLATTTLVLLVSVDLINMVALCTYLKIGRTGNKRTDHIVNKLFLWTIQTGIVTCIGGLTMMILSVVMPAIWIAISLFYPKLYSNAFMATLNGREALRGGLSDTGHGTASPHTGPMQFVTIGTLCNETVIAPQTDLEAQLQSPSRHIHPQPQPRSHPHFHSAWETLHPESEKEKGSKDMGSELGSLTSTGSKSCFRDSTSLTTGLPVLLLTSPPAVTRPGPKKLQ